MKKIVLLFACSSFVMAAHAQYMRNNAANARQQNRRTTEAPAPAIAYTTPQPQQRLAGKATAADFWGPETFGTGTTSTLPTGWTANSMPTAGGGTWKWASTASTSAFTMGAMASATASDGWMIFDSDAIGAASGGEPSGYLQSPAITACATEASVRLNFANFFRNFYDSCSIWVCTDAAFATGTYQVFPVYYNNTLPVNEYSPNPIDVHVNITSAAAMQPTVYIRFVYYGYLGGSYSWMIDDITLSSLDPTDGALDKASALYFSGSATGWSAYGSKPAKMQDTLYPVAFATNYGSTGYPGTTINAKIFQGASVVYDQNVTVDLPVDALDTIADFTGVGTPPGYYTETPGIYTVPFSVSLAGDAVTSNDKDTTIIAVTDSTWTQNTLNAVFKGGQYVHRVTPEMSFSPATGFVVSAGREDTLTSVSVAFDDGTSAGQIVGVQIFHFDGASWMYDGVTQFRALGAAEISSATSVTYATFAVDQDATGGHIILNGGTDGVVYAAVVKGQSNTADVIVLSTAAPAANSIIGGSAYSDTSFNDGSASQQFGADGLPYGNTSVPVIALNFGQVPEVGLNDINSLGGLVGKAFPNPANTAVNVPVRLSRDGKFTVTLSDAIGRTIATQTVAATAGQQARATFATGSLPAGVYLYTVSIDGRQTTGRVSVTH